MLERRTLKWLRHTLVEPGTLHVAEVATSCMCLNGL